MRPHKTRWQSRRRKQISNFFSPLQNHEGKTVLCKSNENEFRLNLCFVQNSLKIRQIFCEISHISHSKFHASRQQFIRLCEILLRTSKNRRSEFSFRASKISMKIHAKLNAISANFRKIDNTKFRTNEKQQ